MCHLLLLLLLLQNCAFYSMFANHDTPVDPLSDIKRQSPAGFESTSSPLVGFTSRWDHENAL